MADNIIYLQPPPPEVAHFIRVGFNDHRRCEHLLTTGKMRATRYVMEAGSFERQASLVSNLIDRGAEIVLDTQAAELSAPGKYLGSAKRAPWARATGPLEVDDFVAGTSRNVIGTIASFAVESRVSAVMAPTHFLGDNIDDWFDADRRACIALRRELDRRGGVHIAIDYPLISTYAQFREQRFRQRVIGGLKSVPFDYLWIRVSGFGADATATGIERYIRGSLTFRALGRPVVTDCVGGFASLAVASFGASSGFSHGLERKERFDTRDWAKPPTGERRGGSPKTLYLAALDRRLSVADARRLLDASRGSRTLFGCSDRECCGNVSAMLDSPETHFVVQTGRRVDELSKAPESLRTDHFLGVLNDVRRTSDRARRLKKVDRRTADKITRANKRMGRVEDALVNLHEDLGAHEFAPEAPTRPSSPSGSGPVITKAKHE